MKLVTKGHASTIGMSLRYLRASVQIPSRPEGPSAKRQPSPARKGWPGIPLMIRPPAFRGSAIGAALLFRVLTHPL